MLDQNDPPAQDMVYIRFKNSKKPVLAVPCCEIFNGDVVRTEPQLISLNRASGRVDFTIQQFQEEIEKSWQEIGPIVEFRVHKKGTYPNEDLAAFLDNWYWNKNNEENADDDSSDDEWPS
jgi:hypothetical protein